MTPDEVDRLPDESRVWIYGAHRPPDEDEARLLVERTRRFLDGWTAHDRALRAGLDWRLDRFLFVVADETRARASGCSIDALTDHVAGLEEELGLPLLDTSPVWFREPGAGGRIRTVGRDEFRRRAREGRVDGTTTVFDLTVDRLGGVREGRWELPAAESWHAALLPEVDPAAPDG